MKTFLAILALCTTSFAQFAFTVNHGMTGTVEGVTITTPQVRLFTGRLLAGNPQSPGATFAPCGDVCNNEFMVPHTYHGNWDNNVTWLEVGNTTTYTITGTTQGIPVVITINNVVFTDTGWHN